MTAYVNITIPEIRVMPVQDIKLADIDVPSDRARELDTSWAQALAFDIAANGVINPITVRIVEGRNRLVTGLHRHAAFTLLEWETIPVRISNALSDDDARREEVSENLFRRDLSARDRCHHLFELKQIYERQHPETKAGVAGALAKNGAANEMFSFAADAAEKTGFSRRAVEIAVKIWKDLTPDSRRRTAVPQLEGNQSSLKELSEQSADDQAKVLDMLLSKPPLAATVNEAVQILNTGIALTSAEKKAATVTKTLKALPDAAANNVVGAQVDARLAELKKSIDVMSKFLSGLEDAELDQVITEHEDRIIASLQRRGRI